MNPDSCLPQLYKRLSVLLVYVLLPFTYRLLLHPSDHPCCNTFEYFAEFLLSISVQYWSCLDFELSSHELGPGLEVSDRSWSSAVCVCLSLINGNMVFNIATDQSDNRYYK